MKFDENICSALGLQYLNPALAKLFKIRNASLIIRRFQRATKHQLLGHFWPRTMDCTTLFYGFVNTYVVSLI